MIWHPGDRVVYLGRDRGVVTRVEKEDGIADKVWVLWDRNGVEQWFRAAWADFVYVPEGWEMFSL